MRKLFAKPLVLGYCLVIALTLGAGCLTNDKPSTAALQYLKCLQEGDCEAAAFYTENGKALWGQEDEMVVLSQLFTQSIFQRPILFKDDVDEAYVRFQIIVPKAEPDTENPEIIIIRKDSGYQNLVAELKLVKKRGEWKVAQDNNNFYKSIITGQNFIDI